MIKINLNEEDKEHIRDILNNDIKFARSRGIVSQLKDEQNHSFLQSQFPYLHKRLYDESSREPDEEKIVHYLMYSREELVEVINNIGSITNKKDEQIFKRIFDYNGFSSRKGAREYLRALGLRMCPYCNRVSVYTEKDSKGIKSSMDHYYPESIYPYLSISVFNLVPCCSYCNSHKSCINCYNTPILYPYEEEFGVDTVFYIQSKELNDSFGVFEGRSKNFEVVIKCFNGEKKQKVELQDNKLRLCEVLNDDDNNNKMYSYKDDIKEFIKKSFLLLESKTKLTMGAVDSDNSMLITNIIEFIENAKNIHQQSEWGNFELAKLYYDIDKQINEEMRIRGIDNGMNEC